MFTCGIVSLNCLSAVTKDLRCASAPGSSWRHNLISLSLLRQLNCHLLLITKSNVQCSLCANQCSMVLMVLVTLSFSFILKLLPLFILIVRFYFQLPLLYLHCSILFLATIVLYLHCSLFNTFFDVTWCLMNVTWSHDFSSPLMCELPFDVFVSLMCDLSFDVFVTLMCDQFFDVFVVVFTNVFVLIG